MIRNTIKIFWLVILLVWMGIPIGINAEENLEKNDGLTALKKSFQDTTIDGEYDIQIRVPGVEEEVDRGYNILFVIDASTSMASDAKWKNMRSAVIEMAHTLLPNDTISKNFNRVGLMSFGVDSHLNIALTNDVSFFEQIPESYHDASDQLLAPGRSATNTEVGLLGAHEYLENLEIGVKRDKEHTFVIYLTDGEANYSEQPYNWYQLTRTKDLQGNYPSKYGYVLYEWSCEIYASILEVLEQNPDITRESFYEESIQEIKTYYHRVYPNEKEIRFSEMITTLKEDSQYIDILERGIIQLHAFKHLEIDKEYSPSTVEKNMFTYYSTGDQKLEEEVHNIFYIEMFAKAGDGLEMATRTITAGMRLKDCATIYTIGYGNGISLSASISKKILDPEYSGNATYESNSEDTHFSAGYYYANTNIIEEIFRDFTRDIIDTNYENPVVIDYTSKWVIPMDVNGDGLFDEQDITITNQGLVIEGADIRVEKLSLEEINSSLDPEIQGNTQGDIYRITWKICEGTFYSFDNYQLSYRVKVDTQENGFVSEQEYAANGETTLTYDKLVITSEGKTTESCSFDIEVPKVYQKMDILETSKTEDTSDQELVLSHKKDEVPKTLLETNDSLNLGLATFCLIGMLISGKVFQRRKRFLSLDN